jgi:hypothetical protein
MGMCQCCELISKKKESERAGTTDIQHQDSRAPHPYQQRDQHPQDDEQEQLTVVDERRYEQEELMEERYLNAHSFFDSKQEELCQNY